MYAVSGGCRGRRNDAEKGYVRTKNRYSGAHLREGSWLDSSGGCTYNPKPCKIFSKSNIELVSKSTRNDEGDTVMKEKTSLALTYDLFQLMKQFPRLRFKQYSTDGLTPGEQGLLAMLVMNFDDTRKTFKVTELSNLLQITPAGVTHLLNPLEETGHIERLQDPHDRRIVRVGLTDKGARAAEVLMKAVQEQLAGLVDHLGEEDSRTLIRLLTKAVGYFAAQPEK